MSTLLNICSHCHGAAFKISSMYNISQDLADYSIIIYKPFAFVIFFLLDKCTSNRVLFDELLPSTKYTEWQMGTFSKQYLFKLTERWCETCVKICPLSVFSFGFLWICSNSSLSVFYFDLKSLVVKRSSIYLYQQTKRHLKLLQFNNGLTLYHIRFLISFFQAHDHHNTIIYASTRSRLV